MEMPDQDPWIDTVIAGRYRLVRKLGEGGMSIVYEATHVKLARQVAIKRLLPQLIGNAEALQRFEREAEMLAVLHHPSVVTVTDWDTFPDGAPCMVLEYLHGAPLMSRIARGPMAWDAIAKVGDQVMSALTLAHRNGITHRDLKPDNIFIAIDDLGDECAKLLDFGVSRLRGVDRATAANALLGTPAYMAPEQAMGKTDQIGAWTDVWAMSAILYEMATGRRAFGAASIADTLMMIVQGRPEPLTSHRGDAPAAFVELVDRGLTMDPTSRTQTIEELRTGLREVLGPRQRGRTAPGGEGARVLDPSGTHKLAPPAAAPPSQVVAAASNPKRWLVIAAVAVITLAVAVLALMH
jgi:serine/threonine-protein kinase